MMTIVKFETELSFKLEVIQENILRASNSSQQISMYL